MGIFLNLKKAVVDYACRNPKRLILLFILALHALAAPIFQNPETDPNLSMNMLVESGEDIAYAAFMGQGKTLLDRANPDAVVAVPHDCGDEFLYRGAELTTQQFSAAYGIHGYGDQDRDPHRRVRLVMLNNEHIYNPAMTVELVDPSGGSLWFKGVPAYATIYMVRKGLDREASPENPPYWRMLLGASYMPDFIRRYGFSRWQFENIKLAFCSADYAKEILAKNFSALKSPELAQPTAAEISKYQSMTQSQLDEQMSRFEGQRLSRLDAEAKTWLLEMINRARAYYQQAPLTSVEH